MGDKKRRRDETNWEPSPLSGSSHWKYHRLSTVELVFNVSALGSNNCRKFDDKIIHLNAIIRYNIFLDVCVVIFNVSYIESFYVKYSMFGMSKILCMSFSVIETYDQNFAEGIFDWKQVLLTRFDTFGELYWSPNAWSRSQNWKKDCLHKRFWASQKVLNFRNIVIFF